MSTGHRNTRGMIAIAAAVVVLAGLFTVGIAATTGAFRNGYTAPDGACSAPSHLPGTVVKVTVTNMGRGMMAGGSPMGGMMRIFVDRAQVPAGTVSLVVANTGTLVHELVVLPLPAGQLVGQRLVGADNTVNESGSLGEASRTCGAGAGDGIDPGTVGWVTLHLAAGNYELICNLPGHYAAGMYTELTVT